MFVDKFLYKPQNLEVKSKYENVDNLKVLNSESFPNWWESYAIDKSLLRELDQLAQMFSQAGSKEEREKV